MLKTTGEFANPLFSFFLSTKIIKALTNNFQHKTQNTFSTKIQKTPPKKVIKHTRFFIPQY